MKGVQPLGDRRTGHLQRAARGLDWPRVNEMRHWARTTGWGFTPHEQVPMVLAQPAYQHLKRSAVYEVLTNTAWRDPQYDPRTPVKELIARSTTAPGLFLWLLLWALAVRRLTSGLQMPPGLGGSSYYTKDVHDATY